MIDVKSCSISKHLLNGYIIVSQTSLDDLYMIPCRNIFDSKSLSNFYSIESKSTKGNLTINTVTLDITSLDSSSIKQ